MGEFDRGTQAKLDFALSEVCRKLPKHGGDHETRKYIAKRLIDKARSGGTTDRELRAVALQALLELRTKRVKGGWRTENSLPIHAGFDVKLRSKRATPHGIGPPRCGLPASIAPVVAGVV